MSYVRMERKHCGIVMCHVVSEKTKVAEQMGQISWRL